MFRKFKNMVMNLYDVYVREFRLALHDQGIMLFFLFLPIAYPVIYSLIYNPELVKNVSMVVVDSDSTPLSRKLTRMMDATDEAHVIGYAANLQEARRAVDDHKAFAILQIPEGFEKNIGNGLTGNAVMYCDMSLLLRYRGFLVASTNVMTEIGAELMTQNIDRTVPLAETIVDGDLLPINNVSLGNIRNGFDSFIMPGVLILILHQCIMLAAGMAGGAKLERPHLSSPRRAAVLTTMVGQALVYITIIALPMIFLIHYVPLIFRFPMAGNLLEEIAFLTPMVIACCGLGFVYQSIVMEREQVFVTWVFTSLILLFLSGLIWPMYAMPPVWKALAAIFPSTWGVEGFVKMNSDGARLWQVADEFRNLWILAGAWWIVGWVLRKWIVRPRILRKLNNQL